MKKFLLLGTIFVATGALAFGGIGIGHKSSSHKPGVDAIGIHIDPNGKKADIDIIEPCPDGLERNTDGSCTVCANGNVYLSYMDDPCGTDTPMNQTPCETDADCEINEHDVIVSTQCCDTQKHICNAGVPAWDGIEDYRIFCSNDNKPCISNNDCAKTEYCNISYIENYLIPSVGSCLPLEDGIERSFNNETYLVYDKSLSFWSAENWCRAHGRHMASLSDLSISQVCDDEWNSDCWNADWEQIGNLHPNIDPNYTDCIITTTFSNGRPYIVWGGEIEPEGDIHQCDGWMNLTVCR